MHRNLTGGGPSTKLKLSDYEQRIKNIIGETITNGNANLSEMGFVQAPSSSSSSNLLSHSPNRDTNNGNSTSNDNSNFELTNGIIQLPTNFENMIYFSKIVLHIVHNVSTSSQPPQQHVNASASTHTTHNANVQIGPLHDDTSSDSTNGMACVNKFSFREFDFF